MTKKSVDTVLQTIDKASELVYKAEVLDYADLANNQYILRIRDEDIVLTIKLKDSVKLWHQWLAYIRYSNIVKLKSMSTDLEEINTTSSSEICGPCIKGHQQKNLFSREQNRQSMTRAIKFLQHIHMDLEGSLPSTHFSHRFYIQFTDDWSGMTKVYIMKYKSKAFQMFHMYQAEIKH